MSPEQLDALLALQQQASAGEAELIHAAITESSAFEGGVNTTYQVRLENGLRGYFKPLGGVSARVASDYGHDPAGTLLNECASWQLAKALGPPYSQLVAACVWREFDGVWETIAGSLSRHAGGQPLQLEHDPPQCNAAALFDALAAQQDRHLGNFLWDQDSRRLTLIDHGYTFARPGDRSNMSYFLDRRHDHQPDLYTHELQALRALRDGGGVERIAALLASDRASALSDRLEHMLDTHMLLKPRQFGRPRSEREQPRQAIDREAAEAITHASAAFPRPATDAARNNAPRPAAQPATPTSTPSRRIQPRR
jgi:hypothetical protein